MGLANWRFSIGELGFAIDELGLANWDLRFWIGELRIGLGGDDG